MDIEEAIRVYKTFAENIFSGTPEEKNFRFVNYGYRYKADNLEEVIKDIVYEKTKSRETMLYEEGAKCKV